MIDRESMPDLVRIVPGKPAGSGGTPPAAPAGVPLPLSRRRGRGAADRLPSIARVPGLLDPPSDRGGIAL